MGNKGAPEGVQATAGGDSGGKCRAAYDWRPAPPLRSLEADEGMVQSGSGPHPTGSTSHTQADNGRSWGALPLCTPPGRKYPDIRNAANIDDSIPTEEEVEWVVQRLRGHRLGGPSRMRAEHLCEWLQEHQAG